MDKARPASQIKGVSSPEANNALMDLLMGIQPRLYAYLSTLLPPQVDANEVLQEVNIAVWQASARGDIANPKAFIWGIARNKAKDVVRRVQRDRLVVCDADVIELLTDRLNQWQEMAGDEAGDLRQQALRSCVERLQPREKQLLARRYESGQTVRAIAAADEQSESALQQFFHRLRLRLRECIERRVDKTSLS